MYSSKERGIALITTMMVMALMSALLVGFTAVVMSDQRYRFIDRNRGQSFYAAAGGIEKLTADLGNLFFSNVAPTAVQVTALVASTKVPSIDGVTYTAAQAASVLPTSSLKDKCVDDTSVVPTLVRTIKSVGGNGYSLKFCANAAGNPVATDATVIKSGPYEGLMAQQTPYQMDVTAVTDSGGETHLVRTMESVAIPVFQFGMFSDVDLSFFAGPSFNFGGRIHTNGNLFLAEGSGSAGACVIPAPPAAVPAALWLSGKVTAVKEVIRERLQNNVNITTSQHLGTVCMAKAANQFVSLLRDQGSVVDSVGSAFNEPKWHNASLSTYNTWIRNGRTGAKELKLPLLTVGGSNPDLIRRPPVGEDAANNVLYNERLYTKGSIRILLSDLAADIQTLPGIDITRTPVQLDSANALGWRGALPANGGVPVLNAIDADNPPIARAPALVSANITVPGGGLAAGANVTLPFAAAVVVPAAWRLPNIVVNKFSAPQTAQTMTCTGKGAAQNAATTTFTGCTRLLPLPIGANTAVPMGQSPTVTATVATPDGNVNVSTALNLAWNANTQTIQVASTMAFSPNTFWIGSDLVTCGGYTTTPAHTLIGCRLPNALAAGNYTVTTASHSDAGTGTIGGFLKIERQNANTTWTDITMEILNYGIGAQNIREVANDTGCADPTPNAILRIQRLRGNHWTACTYPVTNMVGATPPVAGAPGAAGLPVVWPVSTDYEPNVLFDPREGLLRDVALAGTNVPLGGVMHYITLDVANLTRWFGAVAPYTGALAGTGSTARRDNGGFTVYFSDRRNNRNAANLETAEYGYEDFVNPNSAAGTADGVLQGGEDVNASALLDNYGQFPSYNGTASTALPCAAPCVAAPLDINARPATPVTRAQAQTNRAILFRRALKLTNGSNIRGAAFGAITGLTIVSENPVYVQGDWNANAGGAGGFAGAHAATSVIADAVTLLSNAWSDTISFTQPYAPSFNAGPPVVPGRPRSAASWYRMAIIAGKGPAFPQPGLGAPPADFGTDGGAHNFLRYLEGNAAAAGTVNYRGSIATFFFNRQAVGTYKCCATVYSAPGRAYAFDIEFLQPALLPPNTPVFRDMNAVGFAQEMRPGR